MNPFCEHKILSHLPTLGKYLSREWYPPIQVEVDLTNACTSACPWCAGFLDREQHPYVLLGHGNTMAESMRQSVEPVMALIEEFASLGVKSVTWTGGGDPSLHPWLPAFLAHAHSRGLENGLITNGVIDVVECIPYCQWVRFSIDASSREGYAKQHGRAHHWDRVLEHVRKAAMAKGSTTIGVGFVTSPQVVDEIEAFPLLWNEVPVDYIQYRPIMDHYGCRYEMDHQAVAIKVQAAGLLDSRVVKSEAKYQSQCHGQGGTTERCHGIFLETAIAADGKVYACCHLKGLEQYAIGSLEEESFTDIWARHLRTPEFRTTDDCTRWCRHYGTNQFIEEHVLVERSHRNFI